MPKSVFLLFVYNFIGQTIASKMCLPCNSLYLIPTAFELWKYPKQAFVCIPLEYIFFPNKDSFGEIALLASPEADFVF